MRDKPKKQSLGVRATSERFFMKLPTIGSKERACWHHWKNFRMCMPRILPFPTFLLPEACNNKQKQKTRRTTESFVSWSENLRRGQEIAPSNFIPPSCAEHVGHEVDSFDPIHGRQHKKRIKARTYSYECIHSFSRTEKGFCFTTRLRYFAMS